ncbi:MAG: hypothetical protein EHM78_02235 [Myxococcaceae bacterium]|nr:MAG: hypothetical protein EHM78_02235 [Myxococcaceae bacterium]
MMDAHNPRKEQIREAIARAEHDSRNRPRFTQQDLDLIMDLQAAEARENLYAYRKMMDPEMRVGWWPRQVSGLLQRFFIRLKNGHRPKLLLMAPPQHGKSRSVQDGVSWFHGHEPDFRTIFASYSGDLGTKTNTELQRRFEDDRFKRAFPDTRILPLKGGGEYAGQYQRNSHLMHFVGRKGYFENTTAPDGQITGKSLDFGVVDDPIKGRGEAQSPTIRDKTWSWMTDDFMSRFDDRAGMLMTVTRWHVDDPAGRLIERFPDMTILRYPAFATEESIRVNCEPRSVGEALFPEFKSLEFLLEQRKTYTEVSWESLYQQNPIIQGGGMFPIEEMRIIGSFPQSEIKKRVRYWDKAGTSGGGAHTAGVLMNQMADGTVIVEDVVRGQWDAYTRETKIKATAELDDSIQRTVVYVEQEPGSGGKESAQRTVANLHGHLCFIDRVTGKKEVRAEPYAAAVQAGNVKLLRKKWNRDFINEHEAFPSGQFKDQVDASAGAFNKMIEKTYNYDTSLSWVRGNTDG